MNIALLKNILKEKKINHKLVTKSLESLKDVCVYCKIHKLSGQISGLLVESFIKEKYKFIKNSASDCNGDLSKNGINYEVKYSSGGSSHGSFNFVQLRLNHNCKHLLVCYHLSQENVENLGELFLFEIGEQELGKIILKFGYYAHGTTGNNGKIHRNNLKSNLEYSIRPKFNSKCWEYLLKYKIDLETRYFKVTNDTDTNTIS
jgi:hypothetical protein